MIHTTILQASNVVISSVWDANQKIPSPTADLRAFGTLDPKNLIPGGPLPVIQGYNCIYSGYNPSYTHL